MPQCVHRMGLPRHHGNLRQRTSRIRVHARQKRPHRNGRHHNGHQHAALTQRGTMQPWAISRAITLRHATPPPDAHLTPQHTQHAGGQANKIHNHAVVQQQRPRHHQQHQPRTTPPQHRHGRTRARHHTKNPRGWAEKTLGTQHIPPPIVQLHHNPHAGKPHEHPENMQRGRGRSK